MILFAIGYTLRIVIIVLDRINMHFCLCLDNKVRAFVHGIIQNSGDW